MSKKTRGDDDALVEGCIRRDLAAWSCFVKKYSKLIHISIENRLKIYGLRLAPHDIEDIRQNILTSIWKNNKLEGVKNRNNISHWLAVVSGNAAVEYIRKKRDVEPRKSTSIFNRIGEKELHEFIPSSGPGPMDELIRNDVRERIESAIESLPSKERLIAKLNLVYDKKYREIAEILALPKGTVSSYIKRARDKLRRALKDVRI